MMILLGQMHVPSMSTIQSIKTNRYENNQVSLKQKHPIQLGWLSMEDGSHLLTVAIGSKVWIPYNNLIIEFKFYHFIVRSLCTLVFRKICNKELLPFHLLQWKIDLGQFYKRAFRCIKCHWK